MAYRIAEEPEQVELSARERLLIRRDAPITVKPPRRMSARERAVVLCDPETFSELDPLRRARSGAGTDGDGVVTGWGRVLERPLAVIAHDFSNAGGSIGAVFAEKVTRAQRLAIEHRCPI